ncbi:hypothetical protein BP6252_13263 [Coleophoma cylindrospora]|uniref:Aminoglycoside phosphotransferase domain-containing protein n=1 Tax=Coleophoma cylindrospora TaxID=1849047 RepID=A0A3D8QAS4_9HELO|nr:hypothetical protein BP6252_13263 [Coleophoma cylindrospora]
MSQSSASDARSETSTLEYGQEPFKTFRPKVIQLCIDIGLGTPSEVERMTGGSFNRIVGVTFSSLPGQPSRYIIRVPRFPLDPIEVQNIKDQVAVLLFLSQYLPVPKVFVYDSTTDNAIQSQFVVQERLPGQAIEGILDTLFLEERLQLAIAIAELIQRIESIFLPHFGRLVQGTPMPEVLPDVSQLSTNVIRIAGYRLDIWTDMPTTSEDDLPSLLRAMCKRRREEDEDDKELRGYWERLQRMITEMESTGLLSSTKEEARLGHWDLSAQNILVDKVDGVWSVSGVLDWDEAMSVPRVIGRKPPVWLWLPGTRVEEADTVDTAGLTDEQNLVKGRFDEAMVAHSPTFLDDAYHRGKWLRRLSTLALHGFSYSQDWDRYKLLIQDWDTYLRALKEKSVPSPEELL